MQINKQIIKSIIMTTKTVSNLGTRPTILKEGRLVVKNQLQYLTGNLFYHPAEGWMVGVKSRTYRAGENTIEYFVLHSNSSAKTVLTTTVPKWLIISKGKLLLAMMLMV